MEEIRFEKLRPTASFVPRSRSPLVQFLVDRMGDLGLLDPYLSRAQLTRELVSEQVPWIFPIPSLH